METSFSVAISGEDVTHEVEGCSITKMVGRCYDVATLKSSRNHVLGSDATIVAGAQKFEGFVYSSSRAGKGSWSIECRTHTAKLTAPFSPRTKTIEPYATAKTLMDHYQQDTGITIEYLSEDVFFGTGFERDGSIVDSINMVASITKSDIVCKGGWTVSIVPHEGIKDDGRVIPPTAYFDYSSRRDSMDASGIGTVVISTDGGGDSISQIHTIEVDGCSGKFYAMCYPMDRVEFVSGARSVKRSYRSMHETFDIIGKKDVVLSAGPAIVDYVRINGYDVESYNVEGNVVKLSEETTGIVTVKYMADTYIGVLDVQHTPDGRYWHVVLDHNGERVEEQGMTPYGECIAETSVGECIECCDDGCDDTMCIIMPSDRYYVAGFKFYTIGGYPKFKIMIDDEEYDADVQSTPSDVAVSERLELERYIGAPDDNARRSILAYATDNVVEIAASGSDPVEYTIEDNMIYFPKPYRNVMISYTVPGVEHFLKMDNIDAKVDLAVKNTKGSPSYCDFRRYPLKGFDKYDLSSYSCELPATLPVNVRAEIGSTLNDVVGQTISVMNEDTGGTQQVTVDAFGFAFVSASENGTYVLDTSHIVKGSEIRLRVAV